MKKHRGRRAYRIHVEFYEEGYNMPAFVWCNRWFGYSQREAREEFLKFHLPHTTTKFKCSIMGIKA